MRTFLQFAILGIGAGGLYAIAAQGIVLIYRGSGVLNVAHGATAAFGAYVYAELVERGLSNAVAIPAGIAAAAAVGAATYLLVMRPLRDRSAVGKLIASLGVMIVLREAIAIMWGDETRLVDPILPTEAWVPLEGVPVSQDRMILLGIAVLVSMGLWYFSRSTLAGWAVTAAADSPRAASALGWSPDLIALATWTAGGALAGVAGVLLVPITGLQLTTLVLLVVPALAAALVGRFASFPLTLVGGLILGVGESLVGRYVKTPGWSSAVPFVVIIVVLVVQGSAFELRTETRERLPDTGTGRPRLWFAIPAAALVAAWLVSGPPIRWTDGLIATLALGLVVLSLVVVTGYAGQLSLAQMALAGMGAFIAGRLVDGGASFELGLLAGVGLTIPIGVLVALPSVRTRGVSLAVATLGLGLVIERVVLSNREWNGGFSGTQVGPQSFLGVDIDAVAHPERYGLFVLAWFLAVALVVANLRRSAAGRRMLAVRSNERAAAALGVSVVSAKLIAFAIASGIAALGGVLLAFRSYSITYTGFSVLQSIQVVAFAVIGGVGWIMGAVLGAAMSPGALLAIGTDELAVVRDNLLLLAGIALVTIQWANPNGIAGMLTQLAHRLRLVGPSPPARFDTASARPRRPRHLRVESISVRFGGVQAVDGVSLEVQPGQIVGVIGPNGAGKSTLLDAISGFVTPIAGTVTLGDEPLDRLGPVRRSRCGLGRSFQSLELFDDMTVLDNLATASDTQRASWWLTGLVRPGRPVLSAVAMEAIEEFRLRHVLDRKPAELDYGMRRLVAIARAVAAEPDIVLLDEPAAGLSATESRELGELIRRLVEQWHLGVVLIEHDVELVMSVCDRITVLDFGHTIAEGTPTEIGQDAAVRAAYLGAPEPQPDVPGAAEPDATPEPDAIETVTR